MRDAFEENFSHPKKRVLVNNGKLSKVFFDVRHQLLESMDHNGCDIILTGMRNNDGFRQRCLSYEYYDFNVPCSGICPINDIKLIHSYIKIIKSRNIDLVHSYTAKANIYGSIGARLSGVRNIYPVVNGLGYPFTEKKEYVLRFVICVLYKVAFACSRKVFFQNTDDAMEMMRRHIITKEKCILISGSGIDIEEYAYYPIYQPNTFFLASRLLSSKGIKEYCEASRIVKEKYPQTKFVLAGKMDMGPDGMEIEEIQKYMYDKSIEYLGHVNNIKKILKECSVFVLPSYYREGIPHAVLEAMSTGRAIITCNTPGCKETVRDADKTGKGRNGFLVEPRNSQVLAEKMLWMIEHPEEVCRMGAESRKYAEERFDVRLVNQVMMETMGLLPNNLS